MEAHHYCRVVNDDFLQCVLFDGNTTDANLIGVEYIVSGELFATLPQDEGQLWHPHNFEVLSGQVIAPGLPVAAESERRREHRHQFTDLARPQYGVSALRGRFAGPTHPVPGVSDATDVLHAPDSDDAET